ncbi:hypothetical protein BV20DRAFT_976037 [Pilatotrama ljubarskyi]|nr:hypothetical protein BV20DRAFT_976037 [Pilatotrama ljubarskyi]
MRTEAMGSEEVSWIPGGLPARLCRGVALLPRCTVLCFLPRATPGFSTSQQSLLCLLAR